MSSYADLLPALDRLEAAAAEHKARHAAEVADLKRRLDLANADYADLKADFEEASARWGVQIAERDQRIAELEDELGRVEVRRYEP